jgi:fatty-acyl-CoA synthase
MYIGDYLSRRTIYTPDRLALIDAGKTPALRLTFREMNQRANRLANWLRAAGLGKGDRVGVLARDGVEHLDSFFACGKLGAIHTPFNWRLHWRELAQLIQQTTPKVLIYSDDFREAVINIQAELRGMPEDITYYLHIEGEGVPHSLPYESVLQNAPDVPVTCESLDKEDTACLLFTGGTTGLPKGAMISHRMIVWNIMNTVIHDITHGDIYLNVFPLFHTGGLFVYLSSQITLGNVSILVREFDPARILELIEHEKVTVFAGVPTMYQMMTQAPNWKETDLSSLRFCTSGGAPLPVPLVEKYAQEKGVRFKQGFGMTEFGPGLFALAPEDAIRKAGSIGRPNFFIDALAVDDDNRPLGPNLVGELVLKGPSMCSGYFGQPEAFAEVVDEDGWFHTGDLVRYDEEWYFFVVDRKKDMFISGGENVYPAEIEQVLYRHPAVHMAAVIGVPHPKWGQVGKAIVVLKPGVDANEEELLTFMKDHLARYKVPKSVVFVDELPLSGAGKVLKTELRQRFSEASNE